MPSISVLFGALIIGLVAGLSSLECLDNKSKNTFVGIIVFLASLVLATFVAVIVMRFYDVYPLSNIDRISFVIMFFLTTLVAKLTTK